MKKTLKLASLALAAIALMVACKNAPEATEDTTPIDTTPIEEIVEDTMPAIDTVEVAPAEPAKPAVKKAPAKKKEEVKTIEVESKLDGKKMKVVTNETTLEIKAEKENTRPLKPAKPIK